MTIPLMRRYAAVRVTTADTAFIVMLDDKPLQTPAQQALRLPTVALAEAVANEWAVQQGKLDFSRLPLTQLAMTAQDLRVDHATLLEFLETELIVHYAEDEVLASEQDKLWQPLQAWLAQRFGAALPRTTGIMPHRQGTVSGTLAEYLQSLDPFRLTALSEASSALGSFVIALALLENQVDVTGAVAAAEIDSDYQMLRWGEDPDTIRRRAALQAELDGIARFVALLA